MVKRRSNLWRLLARHLPSRFPILKQFDAMDCGPTCLRIIGRYHGRNLSRSYLDQVTGLAREGVSFLALSQAAERLGFRSLGVRIPFAQLRAEMPLPCIVHWRGNHIVVVYRIRGDRVYVADPDRGRVVYTVAQFQDGWLSADANEGVVLMLEPTSLFYTQQEGEDPPRKGFRFLLPYISRHRRLIVQLILGMMVGNALALAAPFLTQALVDYGIQGRDLGFVYALLAAQLMLFVGQTFITFLRSWLLLHISSRINITLISDFLHKLMRLPLSFFDTRFVGDIIQRIGDHRRIETFLTASSLEILFSIFNLAVLSLVLVLYSQRIFSIFVIGTVLYISWLWLFMRRRKSIDERRFAQLATTQSHLVELINGMHEIKLNHAEKQKRWRWEEIQVKLFRLNIEGLALTQYQNAGSLSVNELKNILITFVAAREVIEGRLTLGMMMAISLVVGQLNGPINQLLGFFQSAQDAKLSLDRLSEIHHREDEEQEAAAEVLPPDVLQGRALRIERLSFHYPGAGGEPTLRNLSLKIPAGKVTAIVGRSGSGKTTLLKLLLRFYSPTSGRIQIGGVDLATLSASAWRQQCGTVLQDGVIFSDTVAGNIALGYDVIDPIRLHRAARIAHIEDLITSLPRGYETRIGAEGHGLSQGQSQRIQLARAVYRNPRILLFDEATSDLDTETERMIIGNLQRFFEKRTVIVVAHRLSTVRHADQIVVLDNGKIVEQGTHEELVAQRTAYFRLVRNQLEMNP